MEFTHKLVAVVNKDLDPGVALNAVAHMCIGLGSHIGVEQLRLDTYVDANGNSYHHISQMPFIILRGKSQEIRKLVVLAREQKVIHNVFLHTMTGGTYQEQLANTRNTQEEQLIYYGAVLCGPWDTVSQMTKKFSLWR